jgi:vacuolar-type H+-ATPase subunit I/STV1
MTVTEIISLLALALTIAGLIITKLSAMSKRINDLEKELSAESARSRTEDKNHSTVITEIKKSISDINLKLDDLIKVLGRT